MTSTVTWPPLTKYVQVVRKPYSRVGSDKKCTYDYGEDGQGSKAKKIRTHRWAEDGFYLELLPILLIRLILLTGFRFYIEPQTAL